LIVARTPRLLSASKACGSNDVAVMSGANSRPDAGFLDEIDDPVGVAPIHGTKIGKRTIDLSDEDRFRLARAILASPDPLAPQHTVPKTSVIARARLGRSRAALAASRPELCLRVTAHARLARGLLEDALDDGGATYSAALAIGRGRPGRSRAPPCRLEAGVMPSRYRARSPRGDCCGALSMTTGRPIRTPPTRSTGMPMMRAEGSEALAVRA
jgi:hypothetical protein